MNHAVGFMWQLKWTDKLKVSKLKLKLKYFSLLGAEAVTQVNPKVITAKINPPWALRNSIIPSLLDEDSSHQTLLLQSRCYTYNLYAEIINRPYLALTNDL